MLLSFNPNTQSIVISDVISPYHQGFRNDDGGDDSKCDASRNSGVSTRDPQVAYMIVMELEPAMVYLNEHIGMIYLARSSRIFQRNFISNGRNSANATISP